MANEPSSPARSTSAEELQNRLDDLTDLDVYLDVYDAGVSVVQGPGSCSFSYQLDLQDLLDWTYFFENDYTVRYEIVDDLQRLLAGDPLEGRNDQAIQEHVHQLLLRDWIATDASELMIMDIDGQPLELSAPLQQDHRVHRRRRTAVPPGSGTADPGAAVAGWSVGPGTGPVGCPAAGARSECHRPG
jgi:hypothetical protein